MNDAEGGPLSPAPPRLAENQRQSRPSDRQTERLLPRLFHQHLRLGLIEGRGGTEQGLAGLEAASVTDNSKNSTVSVPDSIPTLQAFALQHAASLALQHAARSHLAHPPAHVLQSAEDAGPPRAGSSTAPSVSARHRHHCQAVCVTAIAISLLASTDCSSAHLAAAPNAVPMSATLRRLRSQTTRMSGPHSAATSRKKRGMFFCLLQRTGREPWCSAVEHVCRRLSQAFHKHTHTLHRHTDTHYLDFLTKLAIPSPT